MVDFCVIAVGTTLTNTGRNSQHIRAKIQTPVLVLWVLILVAHEAAPGVGGNPLSASSPLPCSQSQIASSHA